MSLLDIIDNDLDAVYFNTDDFAKDATWTPDGGSATAIKVIFDDEYTGTNIGTGEIDNADPMVRIKSSTVSAVSQGDTIIVDTVTYYVKSVQPDGTGVTIAQLSSKGLNNG